MRFWLLGTVRRFTGDDDSTEATVKFFSAFVTFTLICLYFRIGAHQRCHERHADAYSHSIKVEINFDIYLHGNRNSILAAWFKSPVTKRLDCFLI